ncbi:MAG: hypothetical protein ACOYMG_22470 [Candidatus Methylumidiphilus sp.]
MLAVFGLVLTVSTLLLAPRTKDAIPSSHISGLGNKPEELSHIVEIPFSCEISSIVYIYEEATGPINAGVNPLANIYIISERSSALIANELIELSDSVKRIEQLRFKVTYEYHADSTENPAILEFLIKDKAGNQIWRGTRSFLPTGAAKHRIINEFSFNISQKYEEQNITVQVKPLRAGDFGFYIYDVGGTFVIRVKQST